MAATATGLLLAAAILGVLTALSAVAIPAASTNDPCVHANEADVCASQVAFVIFGTGRGSGSGQRHRDALVAAYTLVKAGGWQGLVVVASSCSDALELEESQGDKDSSRFRNVRIVTRPQYGSTASASSEGVGSQAARVAEAFRLLPSFVNVAVVLDDHVRVGGSVRGFIHHLLQQRAERSPQEAHTFLAAFHSQWSAGDGAAAADASTGARLSPAVAVLDRLYSASCLRACQLQVAAVNGGQAPPGASAVAAAAADNAARLGQLGIGASDINAHTVIYPSECVAEELDAGWLLQASRFSMLAGQRATFVALPATASDRHGAEPDPNFDVSPAQRRVYHVDTLHVPKVLLAGDADRQCGEAARQVDTDNNVENAQVDNSLSNGLADAQVRNEEDETQPPESSALARHANGEGSQVGDGVAEHRAGRTFTGANCIPHVAVAGCAKCATTTLHAWMATHPNIVRPWQKEPNYDFAPGDVTGAQAYRANLAFGNRGLAPDDNRRRLTIDGSTHMFWNLTHVRNLRRFCPSTKVIVVVCDPVARAMSHWNYRRFVWEWEFLEGMDADTVVRRQLAEMPDWVQRADLAVPLDTLLDFELDGEDSQGVWTLVREGLYAIALRRFLSVFSREQLLVIDRDDMKTDPKAVLRRVEQFLELPAHEYDDAALHRKANVNTHTKEELSVPVRQALAAFYKPHNEALKTMMGWQKLRWA